MQPRQDDRRVATRTAVPYSWIEALGAGTGATIAPAGSPILPSTR